MRILGIETSCDDTGIAIFDEKNGLITNQLNSQSQLNIKYGGIIPELAARKHLNNIIPLIRLALYDINNEISTISAIAYTAGPGLIGSLLVGATIGSSLAYSWNIPVIPINHMEAHLLTFMMKKFFNSIEFPFIGLLVSGKHTQIINAISMTNYKIIGTSMDDAAGEALDKTALLLGINPPGGAQLSKLAEKSTNTKFVFPRPMIHHPNLNFSFSGLKTHAKKIIQNNKLNSKIKSDIARSFEDAIIDVLVFKCKKALIQTGYKRLVIAGGVSSNLKLRRELKKMLKTCDLHGKLYYADPKFCTDNGAMISYLGFLKFKKGIFTSPKIQVNSTWSISKSHIIE
ncbi:tRNA (adenosine(37)-N6)-threonylcarbamoyltransferase complex transferase subunit TsaD [Buchnera aphidicola]|uniref:tRNA N6-adenosine threonylcarbamoyltransferase n=1 Tax=Buchnera aphidicola (Anoecia oenotherae) TaxID=1241833 RepID=A0A4D6XR26_9GAMM|nr:tRNA (adenosine(37)-N6)-threonylcarbamoyltransferase complex transferase subunit TsaD [Buchnera aphidicola]QCI19186.1 tRNA (adenosine(37)-N6)-threonylcarbamoyltransferase complex transferase subunit TsaD [Buchnera aphidicola (Anoecia oenotherae)]